MVYLLTHVCIETIQTRIPSRTVDNLKDFIQEDLVPGLRTGQRGGYRPRAGDTHRLATGLNKKEPIYLSQTADRRQATDDLLKGWFRTVNSGQEYQIWLIIERTIFEYESDPKSLIDAYDVEPDGPQIEDRPETLAEIKKEPEPNLDLLFLQSTEEFIRQPTREPEQKPSILNTAIVWALSIYTISSTDISMVQEQPETTTRTSDSKASSSKGSRKRSASKMGTPSPIPYRTRSHALNEEDKAHLGELGPAPFS